jgi:hypothetical protein
LQSAGRIRSTRRSPRRGVLVLRKLRLRRPKRKNLLQKKLQLSETQEEESTAEETPAEETQEEEGTSSEETAAEETPAEDVAPESTEPETEAPAEIETEVVSDDAGDSTNIEVDEGLLDSSGVSNVSSSCCTRRAWEQQKNLR